MGESEYVAERQYLAAGYIGMIFCVVFLIQAQYIYFRLCKIRQIGKHQLVQKMLVCLVMVFNVLDFPQYECFARKSRDAVKIEENCYILHLYAIWVLIVSFALFMQLWQRLLHLSRPKQRIINVFMLLLLSALFMMTSVLANSIRVDGIKGIKVQGQLYKTFVWGGVGTLLFFCAGFLAYAILLYRQVGSALGRVHAAKGTRTRVLRKIVIIVSLSTMFWSMRLVMMVIWQVQTSYGALDDAGSFAGVEKKNQLAWQLLSQIIPFFGVQQLMLYMMYVSSNPIFEAEQSDERESSHLTKSLLSDEPSNSIV